MKTEQLKSNLISKAGELVLSGCFPNVHSALQYMQQRETEEGGDVKKAGAIAQILRASQKDRARTMHQLCYIALRRSSLTVHVRVAGASNLWATLGEKEGRSLLSCIMERLDEYNDAPPLVEVEEDGVWVG